MRPAGGAWSAGAMATDRPQPARAARVAGHLVAVVVNVALLWVAYRVLDRGWLPFLTPQWREVLPVLTVSCVATVAVHLGLVAHDPPWLRALVEAVLLAFAIAVLATVWRVFPFDLEGYAVPWEVLARVALAVSVVGSAIGIVIQLVAVGRHASRPQPAA